MLTTEEVEYLYKELLLDSQHDEPSTSPLGEAWSTKFWDDREDNISEEEWLETLEIHNRQRRQLINNLRGKYNGS